MLTYSLYIQATDGRNQLIDIVENPVPRRYNDRQWHTMIAQMIVDNDLADEVLLYTDINNSPDHVLTIQSIRKRSSHYLIMDETI